MMWMIGTSVLLFVLWITTVWFAGYVILNLWNRQVAFEDELEERIDIALQTLDESYMSIALVANKPVFMDSPEVRAVVSAIKNSRDAVVQVADIFKDIEIEDNSTKVQLDTVESVTTEDPHNPKDAEELEREVRDEAIRNAVKSGKMEVLNNPIPQRRQVEPDASGMSTRAANAYFQQMKRIESLKSGGNNAQ